MGFHQIGGAAGNQTLTGILQQSKGINVIAPTWFSITGSDGSITSYANSEYVTTCHASNIQVWAVVDNFNGNGDGDTEAVLSHAASRQKLVSSLMEMASTYSLDGINVDFEQISESYSRSYIEFIRELSVSCRANGIVLSVDNYVPMDFNDHYDLAEQGIVCDYVIIMGYDEHYAGSQEAGSVASIDYVTDGITHTLAKVPREKVINALPFYARIWWTRPDGVTSEAHGMADIRTFISNHGMSVSWDSKTAQNYAETTEGDALIQIWIEDAQSIREKLNVMQANEIAGVAEWRLQFETPDIWDEIANYMNS
jgi:spore germination protein YaaH